MGCCCRNYILNEDVEKENEKDEWLERLKFMVDEEIQYDEYTCGCFDDVYYKIMMQQEEEEEEEEDKKYYYNLHYSLENMRDNISIMFYNLHYANAKRI